MLEQLARRHDRLHVEVHERQPRLWRRASGPAPRPLTGSASSGSLFMDSDLTNPPDDIPRFAALLDGPVDYVKASRFVPGGSMAGVPRAAPRALRGGQPRRAARGRPRGQRPDQRLPRDPHEGLPRDAARRAGLRDHHGGARLGACGSGFAARTFPRRSRAATRTSAADLVRLHARRSSGATRATRSPSPPPASPVHVEAASQPMGTASATACRGCGASELELMVDFGELPLAGGFLDGPEDGRRRAALSARRPRLPARARSSRSSSPSIPTSSSRITRSRRARSPASSGTSRGTRTGWSAASSPSSWSSSAATTASCSSRCGASASARSGSTSPPTSPSSRVSAATT